MNAVDAYVARMVKCCPSVREVWLLGSRANNTARPDSDWDLLVFGDGSLITQLREASELHRDDIDCLAVVDADRFESAWGKKPKGGSLSGWEWERSPNDQATYTETKWRDAEDGAGWVSKRRRALLLWRAPQSKTT